MRPITVTVGPLAGASANAICLSQTPNAGALTLNGSLATGGVAVMDTPRGVRITAAANESAHTFTITGTSWAGDVISETITGPNATTADSVLSYATVTSITISANAAGAITAGTNGTASSAWIRLDEWAFPVTAIQCAVSGNANYTVQGSLDDPNSPSKAVAPSAMTWVANPDPNFVNQTTSQQGYYAASPLWLRVLLNSGSGSVSLTASQAASVTK